MRRHGARQRKRSRPKVRWLQDTMFSQLERFQTTDSVLQTTFLLWDDEVDQEQWDPAQTRQAAGALGAADQFQLTPQAELREDRGWRLIRCVGEFNVGLIQGAETISGGIHSEYVNVSAGLCVLDYDDAGNILNAADWHLGPEAFPEDDGDVGDQMRGMGNSWIWRRNWLLQNVGASPFASHTGSNMALAWPGPAWYAGADQVYYILGPSSNTQFASIHLGAHFDIKRHVTLKRNQRLAWALAAWDVDASARTPVNDGHFRLVHSRTYRSLIARAGRPYRGDKR